MLMKVNEIREMQEKLTIKHFEIDQRYFVFETCIAFIISLSKFGGEDNEDSSLHGVVQNVSLVTDALV